MSVLLDSGSHELERILAAIPFGEAAGDRYFWHRSPAGGELPQRADDCFCHLALPDRASAMATIRSCAPVPAHDAYAAQGGVGERRHVTPSSSRRSSRALALIPTIASIS
jgi:hypothetical protein